MTRVIVVLTCLATFVVGVPTASSAVNYKDCRDLSPVVGAIQAKGISCKRARTLVGKHSEGVEKPGGFTCDAARYEGGATWTCKKAAKRFRYSRAD